MAGAATDLRNRLLPMVDVIRGIPGRLGLRLYTVTVRVTTWSGAAAGVGTPTITETGIKLDLGTYPTRVRQVTQQEIAASGGLYQAQDMIVGPITPPYTGSATDNDAISVFEPPVGASPTEIIFKLTGPGLPTTGAWYEKVSQDVSKSFRYTFVLRKLAVQP